MNTIYCKFGLLYNCLNFLNFSVPAPKSDHGGMFGSTGREIRRHAEGKRPKEDAANSRLLRHQHAERSVCRSGHARHHCGHGANSRSALGGTPQSVDGGRPGRSASGAAGWNCCHGTDGPRSTGLLRPQCVLGA